MQRLTYGYPALFAAGSSQRPACGDAETKRNGGDSAESPPSSLELQILDSQNNS
jgi:hypothetical protein